VIGALRKLRVPVSVVVDFDVLSEKSPLDRIVESLGGKWDEISDDWTLVRNSVESKKSELSTPEVNQKITAILNDVKEKAFPEKAKERIREILRRSSPWSIAKHDGKPFVPSGEPHCALERMLAACKGIGLFIVEVGELEGFARTVSGHGPAWVNGVLTQKHLATDSELDGARSFVRQLLAG
jgi:hypothetical protein